jgi:hypothetical protein
MPTLVAQIAPQRSTQYADLANALAPHELRLSALGEQVSEVRSLTLGGQPYLQFDLPAEPTEAQARELGLLSMTSAFFVYYDRLGEVKGPFLRPIEPRATSALPPELIVTRRYRGKTNELFTQFMCNIARASSALANRPWNTLRLFDPLAGGGTTLFAGLVSGASVAGVEQNAKDIQSTVSFLQQFARDKGIAYKAKRERLKGTGRRWLINIGKEQPQLCLIAHGDTVDSAKLIAGFRPHLIVTDLPYGIQHQGQLAELLNRVLPVWSSLLPPSGALVMAWESTRFSRADMIALVESICPMAALNDPPYNALAHRVDRVIKQRDVLVARPRKADR